MPVDLSLISVDDLLVEIERRFDHSIFSAVQITGTQRTDLERVSWKGHSVWCGWLAQGLIRALQDWEREHLDSDEIAEGAE